MWRRIYCPLVREICRSNSCAWFVDGECAVTVIARSFSRSNGGSDDFGNSRTPKTVFVDVQCDCEVWEESK